MRLSSRVVVSLAVAALVSCGSGQGGAGGSGKGTNILADQAVWTIGDNKQLQWKSSLQLGEQVQVLPDKTTAPQYGADRAFTKIRRNKGEEGWVRQDFLIAASVPGVVTADRAVIFADASNTAATAAVLDRMTILAVQSAAESNQKFVKLTAYDPTRQILHAGVYLRVEDISVKVDDVQSAILYTLASAAKDPTQREALLSAASKDHGGSVFAKDVQTALSSFKGGAPSVATLMISPAARMQVIDDKVNVRTSPDTSWSTVVGQLALNQQVQAEERTTQEYTVEGKKAPWYRISKPEGWVFGVYLKEAK
jgi:hypothetical protein